MNSEKANQVEVIEQNRNKNLSAKHTSLGKGDKINR